MFGAASVFTVLAVHGRMEAKVAEAASEVRHVDGPPAAEDAAVSIALKVRPRPQATGETTMSALAPPPVALVQHVSTPPPRAMTAKLAPPATKPDAGAASGGMADALAAEPARAREPSRAEEPSRPEEPSREESAPSPAVE